jgi:hypothetical protein
VRLERPRRSDGFLAGQQALHYGGSEGPRSTFRTRKAGRLRLTRSTGRRWNWFHNIGWSADSSDRPPIGFQMRASRVKPQPAHPPMSTSAELTSIQALSSALCADLLAAFSAASLVSIEIEAVGRVSATARADSTNGISKRKLIYNFSTGRALQTG